MFDIVDKDSEQAKRASGIRFKASEECDDDDDNDDSIAKTVTDLLSQKTDSSNPIIEMIQSTEPKTMVEVIKASVDESRTTKKKKGAKKGKAKALGVKKTPPSISK